MALSNAQIRAIAIRRSVKGRKAPQAANDTAPAARTNPMLDACVAAAGFEQHAAY